MIKKLSLIFHLCLFLSILSAQTTVEIEVLEEFEKGSVKNEYKSSNKFHYKFYEEEDLVKEELTFSKKIKIEITNFKINHKIIIGKDNFIEKQIYFISTIFPKKRTKKEISLKLDKIKNENDKNYILSTDYIFDNQINTYRFTNNIDTIWKKEVEFKKQDAVNSNFSSIKKTPIKKNVNDKKISKKIKTESINANEFVYKKLLSYKTTKSDSKSKTTLQNKTSSYKQPLKTTINNNIKIGKNEIWFTIQIGAFNKKVSKSDFPNFNNIYIISFRDGYTRVFTEKFHTWDEAVQFANKLKLNGINCFPKKMKGLKNLN